MTVSASALVAVLSLVAGCAQIKPRSPAATGPLPSMDAPPPPLALGPDQERRAAALAHYALGVAREMDGDIPGALEHYLKTIENDPSNAELAVRIARQLPSFPALVKKAGPALEAAAQANPKSADLLVLLGIVHRANENTDGAIRAFERAMDADPGNQWALANALELAIETGKSSHAAGLINRALKRKSESAEYWMRLGDILVQAREGDPAIAKKFDIAQVISLFEKALAIAPDNIEIMVRLVSQYEAAKRTDKATALYNQIIAKRPDDTVLQLKLAQYFAATGAKDRAVKVIEDLIKKTPLRHELYNALAELHEEMEQPDKAIETFRQSLVLNPAQVPPYVRIAMIQLEQKKYADAQATMDGMRAKFPDLYLVPFYAGLIKLEQKAYTDALKLFAEAESVASKAAEPVELDSTFYFYFGSAAERTGDIDRATKLFRRSLELKPDNHAALNYLGYMWAEKGMRLDEAHKLINKALELEPDSPAYIDSLGWVLYQKGQYAEAYKHLKRAAELIVDDAIVFDHVADALIKLGRNKEAIEYLRKALKVEPDNQAIKDKLQRLESR